ncbi:MAG: hypothetical protein KDA32_03110 [Phycisphaerales bacterium]|nr:hypothetical protein [Phycisphaerales bacterium]
MTSLVQKRDGSHERFSPEKLWRCLTLGVEAVRSEIELAEVVIEAAETRIDNWEHECPPTTGAIFSGVCRALCDLDLMDVAAALGSHRRERDVLRRRVTVVDEQKNLRTPWDKALVVNSLRKDNGLRYTTARLLASEIEQRVLDLQYRVINASLLRELVKNEMAQWGLDGWDAVAIETLDRQ